MPEHFRSQAKDNDGERFLAPPSHIGEPRLNDNDRPRKDSGISVVIPVYRAEAILASLLFRLVATLDAMGRAYEIICVDDCSPDNSWSVLKELKRQHGKRLKIVRLLTNRGQHNALLCGFGLVTGQIVVTMDDDLQNPPEEIPNLVGAIDAGYDLAIGAYDSKKHATLRNLGGHLVDWLQRRIFDLPAKFQLTSFRAVKRVVVDAVNQMGGTFPYITCMLLSHSSRYTNVPVRHDPRGIGDSNYTLKRSLALMSNLVINYSSYPLYLLGLMCMAAFLLSLALGFLIIYRVLVHGVSVEGWASTVVMISFGNALVLLSMVITFIYISRINQQITRTRVGYAIDEIEE